MVATPAPAAAAGSVQSVWSPLLGTNPGAPVESPVSWAVLAAARRQLGRAKTAVTPAVSVSTGQVLASAVTASAVTVSAPVISSITVGTPNASTGAVVGTVTATDPGKFRLTYKATTSTKGTVSITTAGVFTYTPTATARHAAAKSGAATSVTTDTVTVTVTNSQGTVATQAVTVTVSPSNTVPVAKTPTVGTPNATTGVVTGSVSATDGNGDALTYGGSTTTSKGTVNVTSAGAFTYTPTAIARHAAAKNGAATAAKSDTFSVTVTDGYGGTVAVPVSVTISPANAAPTGTVTVANPDPVTGVATGEVTATDTDADTVTYTASKPASGAVVVNADGSFTYTPTATARTSARSSATAKTDSFTITINDGYGGTKTVSVTAPIAPSDTAPVATVSVSTPNASSGVVTGKINANDAEGDALTFSAPGSTPKGSVAVGADGSITYTPSDDSRRQAAFGSAADRQDSFTVTVTDIYGAATNVAVDVGVLGLASNTLNPGQWLEVDQYLESPNRRYRVYMQGDGNLVLYDEAQSHKALWETRTWGKPGLHAAMQSDGNLVLYMGSPSDANAPWGSATDGIPGSYLALQDDGELVIYQGSTAVWDRYRGLGVRYNGGLQAGTAKVVASRLDIRNYPTTASNVEAYYAQGNTINYDSWFDANGYRWLSYVSPSTGLRRYFAQGTLSGSETYVSGGVGSLTPPTPPPSGGGGGGGGGTTQLPVAPLTVSTLLYNVQSEKRQPTNSIMGVTFIGKDQKKKLIVYISGVNGGFSLSNAFITSATGIPTGTVRWFVDKYGSQADDIMLVGYSNGGMQVQAYAGQQAFGGQYASKVRTIVTFASPLIKKPSELPSGTVVLNIRAKNDGVANGTAFPFVQDGGRSSYGGFPGTKVIYNIDTGNTNDGHNYANYVIAAQAFDDSARFDPALYSTQRNAVSNFAPPDLSKLQFTPTYSLSLNT